MHTQCPDCKTRFRINDNQLRAAQGQVRCSRCHIIFNALEFLQTPPETASATIDNHKVELTPPDTVTDFLSDVDLEEFSDLKAQISNDWCPFEDSDTKDTPTQPDQGIDDELSDVLRELEEYEIGSRKKAEPAAQEEPPQEQAASDKIPYEKDKQEKPLPFEIPANLKSIKPAAQAPLGIDEILSIKKPVKKGGALWSIGILTLLVISISQLAWFGRDKLMRYPEGRLLLQSTCEYVGCKLPTIRAPEQIQVLSRSITTHPKIENALLIQLTIVNKANFSQPYPILQIGLYSSDEMLVVQRRFDHTEYISQEPEISGLNPGKALYVELEIVDPGNDVTGFKLEFF